MPSPSRSLSTLAVCAALAACGGGVLAASTPSAPNAPNARDAPNASSAPRSRNTLGAPASAIPATAPGARRLLDWTEFGLDPQRSDASALSTGITAANVAHLRRIAVSLPGTVDSSPVYLHAARVAGATRKLVVLTTSYGKTIALDADSGRILWTFTPRGYSSWAGGERITNASPLIDPGGGYVYAASPNGLIHKLSLASGREAGGWPVSVTRDPTHEKLGAALNVDGPYLLVATSGYLGDAPPYQGHVVAIERARGRIAAVFNTLCANRRRILAPAGCPASDSAILSRGGVVVEPGGARLLISTGNGPWNGSTDLGDSVIELSLSGLRALQAFTPTDQARLNESDTDLGSSAPVQVGRDRVLIAGKDGVMRLLVRSRLDGRRAAMPDSLGGEIQRLPLPGGGQLFSAPAVWTTPAARGGGGGGGGSGVTVFVGAEHATAAYTLSGGLLRTVWQNEHPGTSPIFAGGLLYVYDPADGGIYVYRPRSGRAIAKLPGSPGHWNSPIVADGHVIEPEGDANGHSSSGTLELFRAG